MLCSLKYLKWIEFKSIIRYFCKIYKLQLDEEFLNIYILIYKFKKPINWLYQNYYHYCSEKDLKKIFANHISEKGYL